ncbi:MAG: DUF4189 domain-containing protein [Eikenella sp.]|nr:DUF4189 domain-containing protein [Eikenella sp.]
MKNTIWLPLLCFSLAAHANPYQPGSQQWHHYNAQGAQMMQEMNERNTAAPPRQGAAGQENVPHHLRPQWHPADNHGAIAVGFNPNADASRTDNPPGVVAFEAHQNPRAAAERARYRCFDRGAEHPDRCRILFAFRNMCGAAAEGRLRNGRGVRFYPSIDSVHSEREAQAAALARCRADAAVRPSSCAVAVSGCANPTKTLR